MGSTWGHKVSLGMSTWGHNTVVNLGTVNLGTQYWGPDPKPCLRIVFPVLASFLLCLVKTRHPLTLVGGLKANNGKESAMEVRLESSTGPQVVAPLRSIDHFAKQTRLRQSVGGTTVHDPMCLWKSSRKSTNTIDREQAIWRRPCWERSLLNRR